MRVRGGGGVRVGVDEDELWDIDEERVVFVVWLLNVPATCQCISGTDLLR